MSATLRIALALLVLAIGVMAFDLVPVRVKRTVRGLAEQRERSAKASIEAQQLAAFREFRKETTRLEAERDSLDAAKQRP